MRRLTALWLSVCLLCGCLSMASFTASAQGFGDLDGNGDVTMRDAMMLFQYASGKITLSDEQIAVADIDQNNAVNTRDALRLYRVVAGVDTLPEPPKHDTLTPISPDQYYGRSVLVTSGQDHMVAAYDHIGEQLAAFNDDISMYSFRLTLPEMERVIQYYYDDHPEVFWMKNAYSYYYFTEGDTDYAYSFQQTYDYTPQEVSEWQTKIAARVKELTEGLTDDTPALEREKTVHDRLLRSADYDSTLTKPHAHDLIGVMLNGTGVCESYARAFQYLLHQCGIPSGVVHGIVEGTERHMWNTVQIDGEWYHVDPTWDDPILSTPMPAYIEHEYFNVTTARMTSEREIYAYFSDNDATQETTYPLPTCTSTAAYWPLINAVELTAYDAQAMGEAVAKAVAAQEYVYFRPVGSYTFDALKADLQNGNRFWDMMDVANALLGEKALTAVRYIPYESTDYGIYGLYLFE